MKSMTFERWAYVAFLVLCIGISFVQQVILHRLAKVNETLDERTARFEQLEEMERKQSELLRGRTGYFQRIEEMERKQSKLLERIAEAKDKDGTK
jgi:hypothetical protein